METVHKGMGTLDIKSWLSLLERVMIDFINLETTLGVSLHEFPANFN